MRIKMHIDSELYKKNIKNFVVIILVIIVIIVALVGTSFSLFSYNKAGKKENTIVTGNSILKCDPIPADTSGANNPKNSLPSNMIPVCYNSEEDVWVKADSTNSNSDYRWYSYNNKVWANAVTVKEDYIIGTTENNKTVNIENKPSLIKSYTSSNKRKNNTTSSSVFTFTAGSNGTYSFEWSVSSQSGKDILTITINGTTLSDVNGVSGVKSGIYTGTATSGTTYTIIASYTKDGSSSYYNDIATIGEFVLPSGSTEIIHTVDSNYPDYQWNDTSFTINSIPSSTSYKIENGKFVLGELSTGSLINKYMCSDGASTTCDTLYLVKEATDKVVSKVDIYSNIESCQVRNNYLNAPVGTRISMDDINTMWVWIPRFKATGDTATYNGTNDINHPGAFDITFVNNKTSAHDAFTFGTQELNGFWMGKFEISHTTLGSKSNGLECTTNTCSNANGLLIKPNVVSLRNNNVSNFFYGISSMKQSINSFGFDSSVDTHMIKNNEWGAVAYLTQSIYGRCSSSTSCTEVYINNSTSYYTGRSGGNVGGSTPMNGTYPDQTSDSQSAACGFYTYDGYLLEYPTNTKTTTKDISKVASTTGNIYGVYDMSGGAYEYAMGVYTKGTNQYSGHSSTANSGFTGLLGQGGTYSGVTFPDSNYYNSYTTETAYTSANLQHALIETKGWYGDDMYFVFIGSPWFVRGGGGYNYNNASVAGVFFYNYFSGKIESGYTSRATLVK